MKRVLLSLLVLVLVFMASPTMAAVGHTCDCSVHDHCSQETGTKEIWLTKAEFYERLAQPRSVRPCAESCCDMGPPPP